MWYKIEEIEEKYGLSKLSIYALITQEPELRQYIKAFEGVLQINEEGIEVLLKYTAKKEAEKNVVFPEEKADKAEGNETLVFKRDEIKEPSSQVEESSDDDDLFASPFNSNSFFENERVDKAPEKEAVAENEDFFANIELDEVNMEQSESFMDADAFDEVNDIEDYADEAKEEEEKTSSFADDLIFQEAPIEAAIPVDEFIAAPVAGVVGDDFYSDADKNDLTEAFLDNRDEEKIDEITVATEDDFNMDGYVKALKEKLVVQNEQIRALSAYLEVSKKMLIQDEKVVNIIEGMYKK